MSPHDAFKKLDEKGFIAFGQMIPLCLIEEFLGVSRRNGWDFIRPYLELKSLIEMEGFFSTQVDNHFLRILAVQEMALRSQKIWENLRRRQRKTCHIMNKADISELTPYEKSKHALEVQRMALSLQKMNSVIEILC